MRVARALRRLDQRVLPPIGRVLWGARRGARRPRVVLVGAAALSLAAVLSTVYAATRSSGTQPINRVPQARVGVAEGESVYGYVKQAAARIQAQVRAFDVGSGEEIVALVSLSDYLTPGDVSALVGDMHVVRVYTHLNMAGEITPVLQFSSYSNIANEMSNVAQRFATGARDDAYKWEHIRGDPDEVKILREMYRRDEAVKTAQARAYASRCACVFAMVVYATPAALGALAERDHVRAVDPAVNLRSVSDAVFAPPRPEELVKADSQDGRAVPADAGP